MSWFNTHILRPSTSPSDATCSSALILWLNSDGAPITRNIYSGLPGVPFGFGPSKISTFAEVPGLVFLVGEVEVESDVTGRREQLPVAVDILAGRGAMACW